MLTLLNTSILTTYGRYDYRPVTLDEARALVRAEAWQSAIGHDATARIVSRLLGIDCPTHRVAWRQQPGERALVLKLNGRPPEGSVLNEQEIEQLGYTWGVLDMLA